MQLVFFGDGDLQETQYFVYGTEWWRNELRALSPYLAQGGVAVDVGANHGFMSGLFSVLAGPAGQVYSFEPSPTTYPRLLHVLQMNNYANVVPHNMACGRSESIMTLYLPSTFSGAATLRPDAGMEQAARDHRAVGAVDVRIVKLDDFLGPKLNRLDLLKIDVEGFEDEVLAGAEDLLRNFKPAVYIELSQGYLASSQSAVALLRHHGYTFDKESELFDSPYGANFIALPPGYQPPSAGR